MFDGRLLAIIRKAWNQIGPFAEIYQLYFEEADWLKRLERIKLKSYYVPSARAIHVYNKSAVKEPQVKIWFQKSNEIFKNSIIVHHLLISIKGSTIHGKSC